MLLMETSTVALGNVTKSCLEDKKFKINLKFTYYDLEYYQKHPKCYANMNNYVIQEDTLLLTMCVYFYIVLP
jgi:hypothetical protein